MEHDDPEINRIYQTAGESLSKVLEVFYCSSFFPDEKHFVQWWYESDNKKFGKSPDELCKEGRQYELEKTLMDIITAAHGG